MDDGCKCCWETAKYYADKIMDVKTRTIIQDFQCHKCSHILKGKFEYFVVKGWRATAIELI